ncbi:MAG: universal stress protein [Tannerellaceae bacterium]|jgi:nucleotide-binding universal stress UspA family protein|nr:universal stress protein [Tannerellaceae bacterium]
MEDNLVTLAIHTYEKAQILKTILETEGIEVYIHNVNLIQPVISAGVRIRIKESDLPRALRIIEDNKWGEDKAIKGRNAAEKIILIPVDFSDYSMKACEIGINHARKINAQIVIMHAFHTSDFLSPVLLGDTLAYQMYEGAIPIKGLLEKAEADMNSFCAQLDRKMKDGQLPKMKYERLICEGLPEEKIIDFNKKNNPMLIVMGTRGKSQKELDLIGSVTGEIIELGKAPVLAIPENVPFNNLEKAGNIAFATSFHQRDLIAFDAFVNMTSEYAPHIHLFNISTSRDEWNEIRLGGIREYLSKQYPTADISHTVLDDGDLLLAIEKFVRDKHIDIIAVTTHRRNILSRMFNPGITRKMLFHTDTPLLVLHA